MFALNKRRGFVALGLALIFVLAAWAQIELDPVKDVSLKVIQNPEPAPAGGSGTIILEIGLTENTHITSREMGFFYIDMPSVQGIAWEAAVYPQGVVFEGDTVFQGLVNVRIPFSLSGDLESGSLIQVKGTLGYQICTEVDPIYCTPPIERDISTVIAVGPKNFGAGLDSPAETVVSQAIDEKISIEDRATRALQSGSLMALLWVFLGGVALSFTPCVYPVIPITIAYIGARSGKSRLHGFFLSLVFVLGLGLVYSALGVFAAATGGVFGLSTQNPYVIGFVTIVFLVMGIGMLGAFEITLPSSIQTKLTSKQRSGYLGALFVGATTGLIAAPCVGPVLIALLSWVSSTGNLVAGFLYLFVFACGLGMLFVVIGTFAGAVTALPKAGAWMNNVKKVFGVILIATAYYFVRSLIPDNLFTLLAGLGLLMLAALLGGYSRLPEDPGIGRMIVRALAGFIVLIGSFYTLLAIAKMEGFLPLNSLSSPGSVQASVSAEAKQKTTVNWIKDDFELAFSKAKDVGSPVIIDFWADWCAACKELDHKTFSNAEVYNYINDNFIPLKVDGSKITGQVKATWERYGVRGLPTVLFMTPEGKESGRFEAFKTADQVMPLLKRYNQ